MSPFPGLLPVPRSAGASPPLTDLEVWFKTPIVGMSDNDNLVTWPDSSGNGNDGTGKGGGTERPVYKTGIINGLPAMRFDAASAGSLAPYVEITGYDLTGFTAGTAYIVINIDLDPPVDGAATGIWNIGAGTAGNVSTYPFTDGVIYDSAMSTAFKTVGDEATLAQWRLYNVRSAASDWEAYLDNVSVFSTATNTFGGVTGGTSFLTLGRNAANFSIDGYIAEFLLYSSAHDTTTRQAVADYIETRFALTF